MFEMLDLVKAAQRSHLRVYFAGKVNDRYGLSKWREKFGVKKHDFREICSFRGSEYIYAGPTIAESKNEDGTAKLHGTDYYKHAMCSDTKCRCIDEIDGADIVLAIVEEGCYGTMWELGYCHGTGKDPLIRVVHDDCWFADAFAADCGYGFDPDEGKSVYVHAIDGLLDEFAWTLRMHENVHDMLVSSTSPLEQAVAMQWAKESFYYGSTTESDLLWAQVPEGPYRIDFANRQAKLAIELDGFTYHSSREQFGKDRERERYLIEKGWKVIRFHGDEIRNDVKKVVAEIKRHLAIRRKELAGA